MNRVHNLYSVQKECQVQTIQESTFCEDLTDNQYQKYRQTLDVLAGRTFCFRRRPIVTYRGVSREHLIEKLSKQGSDLSEDKLLSLLFYFGDKAKHHYKFDDVEAKSLRWLSKIEDTSTVTCAKIYNKIRNVLKHKRGEIARFIDRNHYFYEFFYSSEHRDTFISAVSSLGQDARDYYLYFLHSAGNIGLGDKSFLVSTSSDYYTAQRFVGDSGNGYIICYVIPSPIVKYAVTYRRMEKLENSLMLQGLPTYKGDALYPNQKEFCVRGALFASHIFGVQVLDSSRFVVNPHLFDDNNTACDMLHGLKLDQSDFEERLNVTNYYRGVGVALDGSFVTVDRA